jgi:hypothetical protein
MEIRSKATAIGDARPHAGGADEFESTHRGRTRVAAIVADSIPADLGASGIPLPPPWGFAPFRTASPLPAQSATMRSPARRFASSTAEGMSSKKGASASGRQPSGLGRWKEVAGGGVQDL